MAKTKEEQQAFSKQPPNTYYTELPSAQLIKKAELDDLTLVDQAQKGDHDSMEIMMHRYKNLAKSKARKYFLISGSLDDLWQEGLLGVFKAVRDFDAAKNDNFTSFASMCVISQITDAIRTASRGKHRLLNDAVSIDDLDENLPDSNNIDPINRYTVLESTDRFYKKLETIIKPSQMAVLKFYLEGYAYSEISEKTGLPVKKIDNTLQAVRVKIKKHKDLFH